MKTSTVSATLWMLAAAPREAAPSQSPPPETRLPISVAGEDDDLAACILLAHRMAAACAGASAPPIAFVELPAFGEDGHKTVAQADPSVREAPVAALLARVSGR